MPQRKRKGMWLFQLLQHIFEVIFLSHTHAVFLSGQYVWFPAAVSICGRRWRTNNQHPCGGALVHMATRVNCTYIEALIVNGIYWFWSNTCRDRQSICQGRSYEFQCQIILDGAGQMGYMGLLRSRRVTKQTASWLKLYLKMTTRKLKAWSQN